MTSAQIAAWWTAFAAGAKDWQTLIAGVLALVGAAWTVRAIRSQIAQVEEHARARRKEQERTARAVLPLALSSFTGYALTCMERANSFGPGSQSFEIPPLPAEAVGQLQRCVEFADEREGRQIADLLSWLQVQHVRLDNLVTGSRAQRLHWADNAVIDAAKLHSMTEKLFEYARQGGSDVTPRLPAAEVREALHIARIHQSHHPGVSDVLNGKSMETL